MKMKLKMMTLEGNQTGDVLTSLYKKWRNLIVTILENSSNELFAEAAEEKSL